MRIAFRLALFLATALAGFAADPWLTIRTEDKQVSFTAEEFAALPRTELTAADPHAKAEHKYAGVSVRELLARLGAPTGKDIRGAGQQRAVLIRASDGYAVVFSLAELDPGYGNKPALLCDHEDGAVLSERYGPLRLVVPGDQFAARWVRNVVSLELVTVGAVAPRQSHP